MVAPVTKPERSEAKKRQAPANSDVLPTRLRGIPAITLSNCSAESPSSIGVSIMAGQITFARIFIGANSLAIERVKLITPPFEAA